MKKLLYNTKASIIFFATITILLIMLIFQPVEDTDTIDINLEGQRIIVLGDSITWGLLGENASKVEEPWPSVLGGETGADVDNKAVLSTNVAIHDENTVAPRQNRYALCNIIDLIDMEKYDCCLIVYGIGDYAYSTQMGNLQTENKRTFLGALNYSIRKIKEQNPQIEIVLLTPLYLSGEEVVNESNYALDDYRNAIETAAEKNNVEYVDLKKALGITQENCFMFYEMYSCLTQETHYQLGEYIALQLEKIVG